MIYRRILMRIGGMMLTMAGISLVAFVLVAHAPLHPADTACGTEEAQLNYADYETCLEQKYRAFNRHLPVFYVEFTSWAAPDTLYKLYRPEEHLWADRMLAYCGDWEAVSQLRQAIRQLRLALSNGSFSGDVRQEALSQTQYLLTDSEPAAMAQRLAVLDTILQGGDPAAGLALHTCRQALASVQTRASVWKNAIPRIICHGFHNQYHQWISRMLRGDPGNSWVRDLPVGTEIRTALWRTLPLTLIALILSYGGGLGRGLMATARAGRWTDQVISAATFVLESLPGFWVASFLLTVQAGWIGMTDYQPGVWVTAVMPLLAWSYGTIGVLGRVLRNAMLEVLDQPFIQAAKAKGLSPYQLLIRHALPHGLLTLTTSLGAVLPALVSGSVVIERVFSISGIGELQLAAMQGTDLPIVAAILLLSGALGALGYMLADMLFWLWYPPARAVS
ncbi:MAG: ABC transporter permease [Bacteroidia bacterium]|nr:ABC transporter permease [Bacteroidia bacterium]